MGGDGIVVYTKDMRFIKKAMYAVCVAAVVLISSGVALATVIENQEAPKERMEQTANRFKALQVLPEVLEAIKAPQQEVPEWYQEQVAAEEAAAAEGRAARNNGNGAIITYTVRTDGAQSSLATFSALASETLNDPRGWSQLGIRFREVPSGGHFNLILADASRLPAYSATGCSVEWSCRVGVSVIINEARWNGATAAWNAAGGSLRDYRHMVINHEVGHWLGHDHVGCSAPGAYAPVMQQQSIDLAGCKFNPWPLPSELWTTRL